MFVFGFLIKRIEIGFESIITYIANVIDCFCLISNIQSFSFKNNYQFFCCSVSFIKFWHWFDIKKRPANLSIVKRLGRFYFDCKDTIFFITKMLIYKKSTKKRIVPNHFPVSQRLIQCAPSTFSTT